MKIGKWLVAVVMALAVVACGDDDDPNDPGNSVPDPEGTVALRMRNENNGETWLREGDFRIYIDDGNNFVDDYGSSVQFVNLGSMKGLGNITKIPTSGWASKVAVNPGCGYVAKRENYYIRIYVVDYVTSAEVTNGVIGYNVKYQYPFIPEKTLKLEGSSIYLGAKAGSSQAMKITQYVPYEVPEVWEDWLKITKGKDEITFTALTDAPANSNAQERIANMNIVDETGYPHPIKVRQKSGNLQLEDFGGTLELEAAAGSSRTIKIEYYLPYEIEIYNTISTLEVTQSKTEFTITVLTENASIYSQDLGFISVRDAAGYNREIKVTQKPSKQ